MPKINPEWSSTEKEALIKLANEFIKKCHVIPGVHALEGGIIELSSLLIDFVKYLEIENETN